MNRKKFFASIFGVLGVARAQQSGVKANPISTSIHVHDWKPCAWITWDDSYEVPNYYPPSKLIRVHVCSGCGLIRVPPDNLESVLKGK